MEIERKKTERWVFHGRVQGVGFRYTASRVARSLGLTGFVKNLSNGSVEVCARGTTAQLESVLARLRSSFDITDIEREQVMDAASYSGFDIRR